MQANQSAVQNDTLQYINITFASEWNFTWNVKCFDSSVPANSSFASANRSVVVDSTVPAVTLNAPADGAFSGNRSVAFNYTPADNTGIVNCTLYTNSSGAFAARQQNLTSVSNGSVNSLNETFGSDGYFVWNINCTDTGNPALSNFAASNYSVVVDATAPEMNYSSPTPANASTIGIDSVSVNVTYSESHRNATFLSFNGTVINATNYSMSCDSAACNYTVTTLSNGAYAYFVWMNDSAGNSNATPQRQLTVSVSTATPTPTQYSPSGSGNVAGFPSFDGFVSASDVLLGRSTTCVFTVTADASYVQSASFRFSLGSASATVAGSKKSAGQWSASFTPSSPGSWECEGIIRGDGYGITRTVRFSALSVATPTPRATASPTLAPEPVPTPPVLLLPSINITAMPKEEVIKAVGDRIRLAQSYVERAKELKQDVREAERLLNLARQKFSQEDYVAALEAVDQSQRLLAASMQKAFPQAEVFISLVVLILLPIGQSRAGALFFFLQSASSSQSK